MENLIEIRQHDDKSYKVVTTSDDGWKTALMNDMEKFAPQNIPYMQKHSKSDEVFVLLCGKCVLFVADGDDKPQNITAIPMEQGKVYNIKKGVWHTHSFRKDTQVFIVENADTCDDNSPKCFDLPQEIRQYIVEKSHENGVC